MTPASKLRAQEARRRFAALVEQPEAAIDLTHASLLIAAEEEPSFEVEHYRALLYEMGMEARARVAQDQSAPVQMLNQFMFEELGFRGNQDNYYDPRNSLLNYVLARRTGIPITLSVVYMDIGRRAGLQVEGVGLPGHFIVRARMGSAEPVLVDPFHGKTVNEDECQQRLDTVYGGQVPLSEEHLRAATTREILVRMLRNLKGVYAQAQLYRRSLAVVERILMLVPQARDERRDYGLLLAQVHRLPEALAELQAYLRLAPHAPDADSVREQLKKLRIQLAMLN
jgi:regulator of sirC expression with transglutaminase-like and TPR domain